MPTVDIYNLNHDKVGQTDLPGEIFEVSLKNHLLHEVVVAQLASKRAGSASTKKRADVHGSGRKLHRQKGTGRARAGSKKNPLWRGGGTIFGPSPRDFSYTPPKKVRRSAMKVALSGKLADGELLILDAFDLPEIKTKGFIKAMVSLNLENVLVVTHESNENLEKSARNVPRVKVMRTAGLNVYDVLKYKHLVLLEPCIDQISERLLK